MDPVIKYAKTEDGVNIAYYCIGDGAPPLVYVVPFSHLAHEWNNPEMRAWLERLAATRRLVRFDRRGVGLSDHAESNPDLSARDIEAVVRQEGLTRFALMGHAYSAAIAISYASQRPETVSHLVLWSPVARSRDLFESSAAFRATQAAGTQDWNTFTELFAQQATGWADADQARRFAAYLREAGFTPREHPLRFSYDFDLTANLSLLSMPVLVMHRREASFPAVEAVRKLATNIPSAHFRLFEGSAIVPVFGDWQSVLAAIDQFLSEPAVLRPDGLTAREVEILVLLSGGRSNEAIARILTISTRTVERHIGNIYLKIGAHNRAEATAYALRTGLAPSP